ncbi:MAG: hypothetical protein WCT11_01880 [Candidatus Magasanikbacteria bacterium]
MRIKAFLEDAVLPLVFTSLVYGHIVFSQNAFLGWVILAVFFLWISRLVHNFLIKFFDFSGSLRIRVLSIFLVLTFLGFVAGLLSWIYKMTPTILALTFLITGLIASYLKYLSGEGSEVVPEIEDDHKQVIEEVPSAKVGVVLYLVLVLMGFYFLNSSRTDLNIVTPWQTISVSYVYVFFAATFALGCLLFSKLKSGTLLFLLILYFLLLHAYLPLSHSLFYGADGWRHLAIENNMLSVGVEKTLLFTTTPVSFWQRFNFGGLAYAQFSSLALLFKLLCQVDLIIFLRFFIPIVWSIILPILLLEIACAFNWEKKRALLFVWLSALPFALQVSGSFSLPSNLSFLFWLFILLLQFKNRQKYTLVGQIAIIVFGVLSIFGHSLYFILFCLSFVLFKKIKTTVAIAFSVLLIPCLELISHFSQTDSHLNWWMQIKAVLSNLSAWYVATGLRVSDITTGNIIFNQPSLNALVTNVFTVNRIWICGFMLLFWGAFVFGWYKILRTKKNSFNFVWLTLTVGLLGGYIISRYFLTGENILSRRLDAVLAVLIILPVAYLLFEFIVIQKNIFYQRVVLFLIILFCSAAITASYTLGPDIQVVSQSQYLAADYIWQKTNTNSSPACVLSDTYTLLALEGISGKKVIGGGFPINLYFTQPELEQLLKLAQTQPQVALSQAKKLLNTNDCYLVGDYNSLYPIAQFGNIKIYNN